MGRSLLLLWLLLDKEDIKMNKEKLIDYVSQYDLLLANYLKENYDNFTLANYVDYLAEVDGDKQALCHVDKNGKRREFTYKDLSELSNKMANYLRKKGVQKGDIVALVLRNNYEFYIASLALQKLGAITLTLQYANKKDQYNKIFKRCNPKCVIADDYEIVQDENQSAFVLDELNKSCFSDMVKLCTYPKSEYSKEWESLDCFLNENDEFVNEDVHIGDLGYLFSTSGTTGESKLVMHNYGFALSHFSTSLWYGVEKEKKHYTIADSGWGMAAWNMCAVLLRQGIVYMNDFDRFNPGYLLDCMCLEEINSLCAPRSILVPLLNYLESSKDLLIPRLKSISSAGEAVDDDIKRRCRKKLGITPKEGYGMTEIVLPIFEDETGKKQYSPLYESIDLEKVKGLEGREIVITTKGKIGLFMGYLKELQQQNEKCILYHRPPEELGKVIWHTGDAGHIAEDGEICCDGRIGNTVKVNDCLVNMLDVEKTIKSHPGVSDCCVESEKDYISGNILKVTIEVKPGYELTAKDIQLFVKGELQDYCRPKKVIFDELPRTNNGKVKRKVLVPPKDMRNASMILSA